MAAGNRARSGTIRWKRVGFISCGALGQGRSHAVRSKLQELLDTRFSGAEALRLAGSC